MAIRDLLWCCPECAAERCIRPGRGGETCSGCGTRYARADGARIRAERAGRPPVVRTAAEWIDRLPPLDIGTRVEACRSGRAPAIHEEPVVARFAVGERSIRHRGAYLNRIERLGPKRPGTLALETERLVFRPEDTDEEPRALDFDALTAVQASSSTLQLKPRRAPVASFRFPEGSARFWEELVTAALRHHYRERGRGEIVEFQPRIVTR